MSKPATANPNLVAADVMRLKLPTRAKYEPTHVSCYEARVSPSQK
jgi:hypothetical protein